jgi:hypothetical protein
MLTERLVLINQESTTLLEKLIISTSMYNIPKITAQITHFPKNCLIISTSKFNIPKIPKITA